MSLAPFEHMILFRSPDDTNEALDRSGKNIQHFKINYMIFTFLVKTVTLSIINPYFILAVILLAGGAIYLMNNKEPIKIGEGQFLKLTHLARAYLLLIIIAYAAFGGMVFLVTLLVCGLIAFAHSVFCHIESGRQLKSAVDTFKTLQDDSIEKNVRYIIWRAYYMLCLAIGVEESNEAYNMGNVPNFVANEIKSDLKSIKSSVKGLFKD